MSEVVSTDDEGKLSFEDEELENELVIEYDIASYPSDLTLSVIHEMWKNGDIEIPQFQREFVWTIRQSSLLIDSFLSGLPVPQLFFYIDDENKNLVVDGQQRILSVIFYFEGFFGFEICKVGGKYFAWLALTNAAHIIRKDMRTLMNRTRESFAHQFYES